MVTEIEIAGHRFTLLDGGPKYKPNASISFYYLCETEEELARIWDAFSSDGTVLMPLGSYEWGEQYGWVNDHFGVSWQFALGSIKAVGQKVTPTLLFTGRQYGRAEEAIDHYSTIFKNSKIDGILRYGGHEAPDKEGRVKHAQVAFSGQKFMLMDSAQPHPFTFSEGVSLVIHCGTQDEIDYYWERLTEGGQESMCGWLKDRFGVSWQVVPSVLDSIMRDPLKADKAAEAFLTMRKLEIEQIVQATLR